MEISILPDSGIDFDLRVQVWQFDMYQTAFALPWRLADDVWICPMVTLVPPMVTGFLLVQS